MPITDLTPTEMAFIVFDWTRARRPTFERVPWLTPLLDPLDALATAFVAAARDPHAERRERIAEVKAAARRLDNDFRALDHWLAGLSAWARDPAARAALDRARAEVLPEGRALLNKPVADKAAAGRALAARLDGPVRETLARHTVDGRAIIDHIAETLTADATALKRAFQRRLKTPLRPSGRRRGGGPEERQQFALVVRTLRSMWSLHGADEALADELFLALDDLVGKAEQRRRRRQRGEEDAGVEAVAGFEGAGEVAGEPAGGARGVDSAAVEGAGGAPGADAAAVDAAGDARGADAAAVDGASGARGAAAAVVDGAGGGGHADDEAAEPAGGDGGADEAAADPAGGVRGASDAAADPAGGARGAGDAVGEPAGGARGAGDVAADPAGGVRGAGEAAADERSGAGGDDAATAHTAVGSERGPGAGTSVIDWVLDAEGDDDDVSADGEAEDSAAGDVRSMAADEAAAAGDVARG